MGMTQGLGVIDLMLFFRQWAAQFYAEPVG